MKYTILFLLSITFMTSCSNKDKDFISTKYITHNINPSKDTAFFSEIANQVDHIILDKEINLAMCSDIIYCHDKLAALNTNNQIVYVFDTLGNYLSEINRKGKGPEEYESVLDICYNKKNNSIYLYSSTNTYVKEYTLDGDFISSIRTNMTACDDFGLDNNNNFIFYSSQNQVTIPFKCGIILQNRKTLELDSIMFFKESDPTNNKRHGYIGRPFFNQNNISRIYSYYYDTLYELIDKQYFPMHYLDFGDMKTPLELRMDLQSLMKSNEYILFYSAAYDTNSVFMSFGYKRKFQQYIYNKGKQLCSEVLYDDFNGFRYIPKLKAPLIIDNKLYIIQELGAYINQLESPDPKIQAFKHDSKFCKNGIETFKNIKMAILNDHQFSLIKVTLK